jgi:lysozyme
MRGLILAALILCVPAFAAAQEQDALISPSSSFTVFTPLPAGPPAFRLPQMTSARGISFLMSVEGFRSNAYHDIGGGYSIGYGQRTWQGRRVTPAYPRRVTEEEAAAELRRQLFAYEELVRREFDGSIPQHAFDALVSVCYNVGRLNSSIRQKLRARRGVTIEDFLTTAAVRGQFNRSLYTRRVREFAMFIGRYEDALDSRLKGWTAARRAHQELSRRSVRVVGDARSVGSPALANASAAGNATLMMPLPATPGGVAAVPAALIQRDVRR